MVEVEENEVVRPDMPFQLRAQRWLGLKKTFLDHRCGENFNFQPYTFTSQGVAEIELCTDLGGSTVKISNDEVPMNIVTWLAIISPALLPFITKSKWDLLVTVPSI